MFHISPTHTSTLKHVHSLGQTTVLQIFLRKTNFWPTLTNVDTYILDQTCIYSKIRASPKQLRAGLQEFLTNDKIGGDVRNLVVVQPSLDQVIAGGPFLLPRQNHFIAGTIVVVATAADILRGGRPSFSSDLRQVQNAKLTSNQRMKCKT